MQDVKCVSYYRESPREIACDIDIADPVILSEGGLNLLIQIVVINLLKTPGLDAIEPEIGGGLMKILEGDSPDQIELGIQANITQAVAAVEYQIKRSQMGMNYPKEERLARLGINSKEGIFLLEDERGVVINLEIANEAGSKAIIALPIRGHDD